jgi:hypothetical protein
MLGLKSRKLLMASLTCASSPAQLAAATAEEDVALADSVWPPLNISFTTPSESMMFWYTIACQPQQVKNVAC